MGSTFTLTLPAVPGAPESTPAAPAPTAAAPYTATPSTAAEHEGMVTGAVWVANEEDASLSVIDAGTNRVVTTVHGVEGPHNVQVSPDSASVWAVSGHDSLAVALDARSLDLTRTVTTGVAPVRADHDVGGRPTGGHRAGQVQRPRIERDGERVVTAHRPHAGAVG